MTRIAKLYQRTLDGRSLSFAELQRLFEAFGFMLERTNGSHMIYHHAETSEKQVGSRAAAKPKAIRFASFLIRSRARTHTRRS